MMSLFKLVALLLALASVCQADGFTDENEHPPFEPFLSEKAELFRFSRSAKGSPAMIAKYEQQRLRQQAEKNELNRQQQQQVDLANQNEQQNQQQAVANEAPDFSGGAAMGKTTGEMVTSPQVAQVAQEDSQQQKSKSSSTSSSKSASSKKSALTKIITTTTTTTTTTQNNQDQPQVAQIKEIRVHTVPLSQAVHYANYMVVPTSSGASQAAHLEESSSSSSSSSHRSSSSSSSSTTGETEQVAVAPETTLMVNPPPAAVAPDCVLHRLIVERPVSSQLMVNVAPEVKVQHSSSSSSHSSKIVSESAMAVPEVRNVYTVTRVIRPAPIISARMVAAAPANDGHLKEEHFRSESHSHEESNGLGHLKSSSSSSSSSRTSKSSSTTTSQTSALVAPPPPVQTMTIVRQSAPLMAIKAAPMVQVASRSNDVSVNVDHHQSGPNYNYGYSIKQHSSEPGTKGVVVGERVVYLKK